MLTQTQIQQIKDMVRLTIVPAVLEDFNVSSQEEVNEIVSTIAGSLLTEQIIFIPESDDWNDDFFK